jgi:hypothetical protein
MSATRLMTFRGVAVVEGWPQRIRESQARTHIALNGSRFGRVPYGAERSRHRGDGPCPDCAVIKGEYHVTGCDGEECPSCHAQLVTCACGIDE